METDAEITLRTLVEQRDRLLKEIEALRNQVAGIGLAIDLISQGSDAISQGSAAATGSSGDRVRVSRTLIQLLHELGDAGLTPKTALEVASRRGIRLNRGSVYTLLKRMERAGTVVHENSHYRLTKLSSRSEGADSSQ